MQSKKAIYAIVLIICVLVMALSTPTSAKTQHTLDKTAIDAYIEDHMAEHQIPGLALSIVHNDEIVIIIVENFFILLYGRRKTFVTHIFGQVKMKSGCSLEHLVRELPHCPVQCFYSFP